MARGGK
jgi:hypothetical protein